MYIVLEIQKVDESSVGTLINSYENRNEAESKYYTVLAAAAISTIPQHSVIVMEDNGVPIKFDSYNHPVLTNSEE